MKRGDVVTVAIAGDYGKPRPAIVIQSDNLSETDSVLVCLLTTTLRDAPLHRLNIPDAPKTGLRESSQVMIDKIMAVRRDRCVGPIGQIEETVMRQLNARLAFIVGLAD